jgi:hypothetical protein
MDLFFPGCYYNRSGVPFYSWTNWSYTMISSRWKVRGILAGGIVVIGMGVFYPSPGTVVIAGVAGFLASEFAMSVPEDA